MPFAKHSRGVTVVGEQISECFLPFMKRCSPRGCSIRTRPRGIASRHQPRPRGRAKRRYMKISETHRFRVQSIEVRRLEGRITVTRKVAVPLVIGHHQNDVGLGRLPQRCGSDRNEQTKAERKNLHDAESWWSGQSEAAIVTNSTVVA